MGLREELQGLGLDIAITAEAVVDEIHHDPTNLKPGSALDNYPTLKALPYFLQHHLLEDTDVDPATAGDMVVGARMLSLILARYADGKALEAEAEGS